MDPTDGLAIVTLAGVNTNNLQFINVNWLNACCDRPIFLRRQSCDRCRRDDQLIF